MDRLDIRILDLLQRDSAPSVNEVAERVGLSTTPCWRRIKALEDAGVIKRRIALLDPDAVNLGVTVFVAIKTGQHNEAWLGQFAKVVAAIPEVMEVYRMSGEIDYLMRVVVPDVATYDRVYKKLIQVGGLTNVSSSFAMECIKAETALPLAYAPVK
jgi:Lrp/AsnC family transcriptional regulator